MSSSLMLIQKSLDLSALVQQQTIRTFVAGFARSVTLGGILRHTHVPGTTWKVAQSVLMSRTAISMTRAMVTPKLLPAVASGSTHKLQI